MFATRTSRRRAIVYAILLALSLLVLAAGNTRVMQDIRGGFQYAVAPIQDRLAGATRSVTSIFGALAEIDRLRGENRDLQAQIQALQVETKRSDEIKVQNQLLTDLLKVRSALSYETVAAEVIGRQLTDIERVITLNQGTDRGISKGDVVVGSGGALVGRVVEVGRDYAGVRLISDTRSTVIGFVASSRAIGDVQGQLSRPLVMSNIPATDKVAINDSVVTAGIEINTGIRSAFPKGLVIGRVVDVQNDRSAVVQTAYVQPEAQLEKLEYVLVITDYEGGLPIEPAPSASPRPGSTPSPSPSSTSTPAGVPTGSP